MGQVEQIVILAVLHLYLQLYYCNYGNGLLHWIKWQSEVCFTVGLKYWAWPLTPFTLLQKYGFFTFSTGNPPFSYSQIDLIPYKVMQTAVYVF